MRASAIVSMDLRTVDLQPTIDYGRNNGRSPLLESNGLYYAVGNANNGNAAPKPLLQARHLQRQVKGERPRYKAKPPQLSPRNASCAIAVRAVYGGMRRT